jgi:hypothetical protein
MAGLPTGTVLNHTNFACPTRYTHRSYDQSHSARAPWSATQVLQSKIQRNQASSSLSMFSVTVSTTSRNVASALEEL